MHFAIQATTYKMPDLQRNNSAALQNFFRSEWELWTPTSPTVKWQATQTSFVKVDSQMFHVCMKCVGFRKEYI